MRFLNILRGSLRSLYLSKTLKNASSYARPPVKVGVAALQPRDLLTQKSPPTLQSRRFLPLHFILSDFRLAASLTGRKDKNRD